MGLRITTNVAAMTAQRHLANATVRVNRSLERLSSGLRINRAADDPAGLAVSERLRAQIRALQVGERNAGDGISLLQIADGGLAEVADLLIRLNELAEQAMTGTVSNEQRGYLDNEFRALVEEIDRIAVSIDYNGRTLLDGSGGDTRIEVGSGPGSGITLDLARSFTAAALGLDQLSLAGDPAAWTVQPLTAISAALQQVSAGRASFGASQNRLESAIRLMRNQQENLSAADSRIRDVDYAAEMSELTSAQILQQMAIAALVQAQRQPALALQLLGLDRRGRRS
jgi:flagellin